MKINSLRKFAWVFFALALATTSAFSQGWRGQNRNFTSYSENCVINISGLSEKQENKILELEEKHQKAMTELREKRRSTSDAIEKSEIRTEMLKTVEAHRKEVKSQLSDEQQKQYEQLHALGGQGKYRNYSNQQANFRNHRNGNRNFGHQNFAQQGRGFNVGNGRFNCANVRNGYGNRNRVNGRNANSGSGNKNFQNNRGRFYWQNNVEGSQNVSEEGFEIIEEKEFEEK